MPCALIPRRSRAFHASHAPRQRLTQACAPGHPDSDSRGSMVSSIRLRKPGSSTSFSSETAFLSQMTKNTQKYDLRTPAPQASSGPSSRSCSETLPRPSQHASLGKNAASCSLQKSATSATSQPAPQARKPTPCCLLTRKRPLCGRSIFYSGESPTFGPSFPSVCRRQTFTPFSP